MSSSDRPVYLVAQLAVKDLDDFMQRYVFGVSGQMQKAGAEVLAAAPPQILEGDQDVNRTVLIRFPSLEIATNWYESEEYLPFRELRKTELTTSGAVQFVEEFDPSAFA
ncbi:MAG TPA: DUF1330 domain-containing protein [Pyrinomonadaceae bacterium]|nr:DUF1330 domain-containing protein [Pyrinomonadaceae bacterium]HMP64971.1 DUF1330 domain-containing protein [Pyrinomonadaceae bacterium]